MFTRGIALRRDNKGNVTQVAVSIAKAILIFNVGIPISNQTVPIPKAEDLYGIAFDKTGRFLIVVDRRVKGKSDESKFHVLDAANNYNLVFTSPKIINPSGVAIAPNGQIYIYNEGIQIYDLDTSNGNCTKSDISIDKKISCPTGSDTTTTGGIAFDMLGNIVVSNNIAAISKNNSFIRILSPDGAKQLKLFPCQTGSSSSSSCSSPDNIAFDKECKHLIVTGINHVRVFTYTPPKPSEKDILTISPIADLHDGLNDPRGIAISNNGEIYVCDHKNVANQIKIVSFD